MVGLVVLVALVALSGCSFFDDSGSDDSVDLGGGEPTATEAPTPDDAGGTATPGGGTGSGNADTATPGPVQAAGFELAIVDRNDCGSGCSDVTYDVENVDDEDKTGVNLELYLRADGETVWSDTQQVGAIPQGQTYTDTVRVEVGLEGGSAIRDNGDRATMVVVVNTDQGSETIRQETTF